jgi:hypothetical protein
VRTCLSREFAFLGRRAVAHAASKVEDGPAALFPLHEDQPAPRAEAGCTGYRDGGKISWAASSHGLWRGVVAYRWKSANTFTTHGTRDRPWTVIDLAPHPIVSPETESCVLSD